jgi:hypothetical protein
MLGLLCPTKHSFARPFHFTRGLHTPLFHYVMFIARLSHFVTMYQYLVITLPSAGEPYYDVLATMVQC